ncbi:GHMP kinase [bacterium]|nr:GHMP kinase [bacterium]
MTKYTTHDLQQFKYEIYNSFRDVFDPARSVFAVRAPARLDVIGGIADYSGSVVLESTLSQSTVVGIQRRSGRQMVIRSLNIRQEDAETTVQLPLDDIFEMSIPEAQDYFRKNSRIHWAAYVAGSIPVLRDAGVMKTLPDGMSIGILSNIPIGAGVSSSASLEVASMLAVLKLCGLTLDPECLPELSQQVENEVVGAPCGIMDQMTATFGRSSTLFRLKCQPHEILDPVNIPAGIHFYGINSAVRHSVEGCAYKNTRIGTFMGRKIIFEHRKNEDHFTSQNGYLCNVTPEEWRLRYQSLVPESISGKAFIREYGTHDDHATAVAPDQVYYPRKRTSHPIHENARVVRFAEIMERLTQEKEESLLIEAGELMLASHRSYSENCDMGSGETDLLVGLVMERGAGKGLYGAKITGGGSGGTVAIMAREGSDALIQEIAGLYVEQTGLKPDIFSGSSPGAHYTPVTEVHRPAS